LHLKLESTPCLFFFVSKNLSQAARSPLLIL
jgi:hypothetical protein